MNLAALFKSAKRFFSSNVRTGTKIAVWWLIFSAILIAWLTVGIPIISIYFTHMTEFAKHISGIITALITGSSVAFTATEVRKTVENVKQVVREGGEPND